MEDTWSSRDLPVLAAVVELYEETSGSSIRATDIARRSGFDQDTVQRALRALYSGYYLQEEGKTESSGPNGLVFVGPPTGEARRVVGAWPSPESLLERLIAGLESAAEEDERPVEERNKLKQTATWLGSFAAQVAIGALGGAGGNIISA